MLHSMRPLMPVLALLAGTIQGTAQTTGPMVNELSLERVVSLPTTLSTVDLALPPDKVQGILNGSWEVRERLIFNPSGATITSTLFVVQTGSGPITPLNANLSGFVLGVYTLSVERVYSTVLPRRSVAFSGTVAGSTFGGVLGNVAGMPFLLSMGYSDDLPARVTDVVHVIAGRVVVYSREAAGTLVVARTVAPPPPGVGLDIVVLAPSTTTDSQIVLDASRTTDTSGTPLRFSWVLLNKTSAILNPNSALATVQFGEGMGDYTFELTVTNGNGVSAKKTVTVTYYGR